MPKGSYLKRRNTMNEKEIVEEIGMTGYEFRCLQLLKDSFTANRVVELMYLVAVHKAWLPDLKMAMDDFRLFCLGHDDLIIVSETAYAYKIAIPYMRHMKRLESPIYLDNIANRMFMPDKQQNA
jgi:hypothetical protein